MEKKVFENIIAMRLSKGLSKADMARACGITPTAYANIEKGDLNSISIDIGKAISKALDASFIELFDIETQNSTTEQIEKLGEEVKNLRNQLEDKALLVDLLLKEKEIFKRTAIISIIEHSDSILNEIDQQMADSIDDSARKDLFFERQFIVNNKKAILDRFIDHGYFQQVDIDNFYKDIDEHHRRMEKYGYSSYGSKINFK